MVRRTTKTRPYSPGYATMQLVHDDGRTLIYRRTASQRWMALAVFAFGVLAIVGGYLLGRHIVWIPGVVMMLIGCIAASLGFALLMAGAEVRVDGVGREMRYRRRLWPLPWKEDVFAAADLAFVAEGEMFQMRDPDEAASPSYEAWLQPSDPQGKPIQIGEGSDQMAIRQTVDLVAGRLGLPTVYDSPMQADALALLDQMRQKEAQRS